LLISSCTTAGINPPSFVKSMACLSFLCLPWPVKTKSPLVSQRAYA
jgi:hypothetical protein